MLGVETSGTLRRAARNFKTDDHANNGETPAGAPRFMVRAHELILTTNCLFQGGYEMLAELGTGSFGQVYKARQLSTGQEVAIKILRLRPGAPLADVSNQTERF